jgi:ATP-dependent exoDNAse (exonuclease V) alpha subunit
MLAVVVADVEIDGDFHFERQKVGTTPADLRALADWLAEREVEEVVILEPESRSDGDRRLYVLDESSLASTKQMHELFERFDARDRVVLVGDARQHQAVEAGRPYEQSGWLAESTPAQIRP